MDFLTTPNQVSNCQIISEYSRLGSIDYLRLRNRMHRLFGIFGYFLLLMLIALPIQAQTPSGSISIKHAMLSGPSHCADCHDLAQGKPVFKCINCHADAPKNPKVSAHAFMGANTNSNICAQCHKMHGAKQTEAGAADKKAGNTGGPHGAIGIACGACHTATSFKPIRPFPDFKHSQTRFRLGGMHAAVDCRQCHTKLVFKDVGNQCADCHADFHRRQLGSNCEKCHTPRGWRVTQASVQNHANRFPLIGAHAAVDCQSCHKDAAAAKFQGLSTSCTSCHLNDFKNAKSPDHSAAGFSTACESCHSGMDNWVSANFAHSQKATFALTGAHAKEACTTCHSNNVYTSMPSTCESCHLVNYNSTTNPSHAQAGFSRQCATCHSTTTWAGASFNHSATKLPLTGAHSSVQCATCHKNNVYAGLPSNCDSCHLTKYNNTKNPNHVQAGFPQLCTTCHNTTAWAGATFSHSTTKFQLTGAHTSATCTSCHTSNVYAGLPSACDSCHLTNYNSTTNPNHAQAGFPRLCSTCHSTATWAGATLTHTTKFALTGAHIAVQCATCHKNNVYAGLPSACGSCHSTTFNSTTNPNHAKAGFSQDCSLCHTTTSFQGGTFNHNTTPFPLTGTHVGTSCISCHKNEVYAGLPSTCASCHLPDYNSATSPNHVQGGFPQLCTTCHNTTAWTGTTFTHTTKFSLTGAHTSANCTSCHSSNVYAGLPSTCDSCHLAKFNSTTNPSHAQAGFSRQCASCHSTTTWAGASFNHSTTKLPLTGAHSSVQCATCHKNNVYAGLPSTCDSCHLTNYNNTKNPNHVQAGFPQLCTTCHNTTAWTGATFSHSTTKFQLTGAHTSAACTSCHTSNVYAGLPSNCDSCHLTNYNSTTNPSHAQAGFSRQCASCHSTTTWAGASFNHSTTKLPLTGAHSSVQCATCHKNNVYAGLPSNCDSCHLTNYNNTKNPNHVQAGFPQLCTTCHNTTAWTGATFTHTTKFALTGAHTSATCTSCHTSNVYAGLPSACDSCHLTNYNGTTNPNHTQAGFPRLCSTCHSTTSWAGATFTHTTKFALTGAHTTVQCATCHKNNVYAGLPSTCASCHLPDYNSATSPNHAQAGFPQLCTTCHNTTAWTGATFTHTTKFALTGAHTSTTCTSCHTSNVYAGLPSACDSCHLVNYTGTTNPNHTQAGFPRLCSTCHSTTSWAGATFTHTTKFALSGAHAAVQCATCHKNNVYAGLPATCASCHITSFNSTTNPNHVQAGFPQDCSLCHSTTSFQGGTFNHNSTPFPLTGRHVSTTCTSCHKNEVYAGLATTCVSCHLASYNAVTSPNHVQLGYPQLCSTCHTTTAWTGATFSHSTTAFALTGAHTTVQCTQCHINNQFAGTPKDCYSCHSAVYKGVTDPNHVAAGFPTTCTSCHTTTTWTGATFTHNWWSTTHGRAKLCSDCHTNPTNYTVFTCTSCHTKSQMDSRHSGRSGYVYNSTNCYQCHRGN